MNDTALQMTFCIACSNTAIRGVCQKICRRLKKGVRRNATSITNKLKREHSRDVILGQFLRRWNLKA
jgi:hypothetical protein